MTDTAQAADVGERFESEVRREPSTSEARETPNTSSALVEADLLVEDVSIDGMCGVY
jgi:mycofactocin precursor